MHCSQAIPLFVFFYFITEEGEITTVIVFGTPLGVGSCVRLFHEFCSFIFCFCGCSVLGMTVLFTTEGKGRCCQWNHGCVVYGFFL